MTARAGFTRIGAILALSFASDGYRTLLSARVRARDLRVERPREFDRAARALSVAMMLQRLLATLPVQVAQVKQRVARVAKTGFVMEFGSVASDRDARALVERTFRTLRGRASQRATGSTLELLAGSEGLSHLAAKM